MRDLHRYLKTLAATAVTGCVCIVGIDLVVDPFGAVGLPIARGLDSYRDHHSRTSRGEALRRRAYDVLVLGTSRAQSGFDPQSPAWGGRRVYNAALTTTNLYELRLLFEHAWRERDPIEHVVLSVELLSVGARRTTSEDFAGSRLDPSLDPFTYWAELLVSRRGLDTSLRTLVRAVLDRPSSHRADGFRARAASARRGRFEWRLREHFLVSPGTYNGFVYGEDRLEGVRHIVRSCRDRGTRAIVLVPPLHVTQLEAIRSMGLWDEFERMLRDLAAAVPGGVWDFTGFEGRNAESVPEADGAGMRWYSDSSHFTPALGDLVIARIMGHESADVAFGVRLTPDDVDAHLGALRAQRARWAEENPEVVRWIERLHAETARRRARQARLIAR